MPPQTGTSSGMKKALIAGSIVVVIVGLGVSGALIYRARVIGGPEPVPAANVPRDAGGTATVPLGTSSGTGPPASAARPQGGDRGSGVNVPIVSDDPTDTDHDGLTDAEEAVYRTDPAVADTDGDGWDDFQELRTYGTDPLDPAANPDTVEARYNPDK